jgi:transcriptional regulator with XRE-family HTH domain
MPTAPDNHDAHDYAERIRERLPRRLQDAREAAGLTMYALWRKCGVSRDMISRIEAGESIPTFHVGARLAYGVWRMAWTRRSRSSSGRWKKDERPLLVAGTPEVREYRMRFWDKGTPNGDWTDVVKVTVSP